MWWQSDLTDAFPSEVVLKNHRDLQGLAYSDSKLGLNIIPFSVSSSLCTTFSLSSGAAKVAQNKTNKQKKRHKKKQNMSVTKFMEARDVHEVGCVSTTI